MVQVLIDDANRITDPNITYREAFWTGCTVISASSSGLLLASSASASRFGEEPKAGGGWMLKNGKRW